ncbi:MAG: hypothetical protein GY938_32865, partial [Ketobacter sp.]|nr:hypothetical protein [Ketobacter sp.]
WNGWIAGTKNAERSGRKTGDFSSSTRAVSGDEKKTTVRSASISREASPVKKSEPSSRRKHISDTSYRDSISAQ